MTKQYGFSIDADRCIGCGNCIRSCPYGAPRYNETLKKAEKCSFCWQRIDAGLKPACVLSHLSKAWLSREVLGMSVFLGLVILTVFTIDNKARFLPDMLSVLPGLAALLFTGMTYAPPSFPAINNVLPFVFFLITSCILGSAFAVYFTPEERKPVVTTILTVSLILALVVYLVVPCIWLSGGTVMAMTGKAWIGSGL